MALVKCRDCAREISSQAYRCPHCGAATHASSAKKRRLTVRKSGGSFGCFLMSALGFIIICVLVLVLVEFDEQRDAPQDEAPAAQN